MKIIRFTLFLVLLCTAASLPPAPPVSHRPHKSALVERGAGARALIAKIVPSVSRTNTFTWFYPPGIDPASFWWNIESSTDLKNWTTLVTNASGSFDVHVNKSQPLSVYRLRGRLSP